MPAKFTKLPSWLLHEAILPRTEVMMNTFFQFHQHLKTEGKRCLNMSICVIYVTYNKSD